MNNPGCIDCLTHIVQWSNLADENERLQTELDNAERITIRLRRKINRLKRRMELANQLIERQDVLLTALAHP